MTYRGLVLIALMFMVIVSSVAQRNGVIWGRITDEDSGDRFPFATVTLKKDGQMLPIGTVSDNEGTFKLSGLQYGTYDVLVSFIGYKTHIVEKVILTKEKPRINLGDVTIALTNVDLEEVKVSAMGNTVSTKIDRKTYRAEDFSTARGGTAVDVLNKLPSVSVSSNGEVSVRGTTDFMVYLNGKPTQMEPSMLLAQIAGANIQNIDVITVPTAKYDAQGKGGIININTKKNGLEGFSISANGKLGASPWANKTDKYDGYHMKDDRYGSGINLMYGINKLALYGAFNYNKKNVNGARTGKASVWDYDLQKYKHMDATGERPEWYEYYSANAGVDYQLSKNTQLSASYFFGDRTEGRSAFYVYHNYYGDESNVDAEKYIYNPNTDNRYGKFHTGNVDFSTKFGQNATLRISLLYEHSDLSRRLDNKNYGYDKYGDVPGEIEQHYSQSDDTPLDAYRFSVDYSKELANGNTIGIGLQPQFFQIDGAFSYDTSEVVNGVELGMFDYETLENAIDLNRGVYAAYIDYSGSIHQLKYMLGLRLEYTDQRMKIANPDYFTLFEREKKARYEVNQLDWFPTVHATYPVGETSQLSLAASRRISRPPIKNMAPFLYRRHLEVYEVGDPDLESEYINNVELGLEKRFGKHKVGITGFYRGVENAIFRVNTTYQKEVVLIRSYTNSGDSRSLGLELNANLQAGNMAKFFIGGSVYDYRVKGDIFGYQADNSSVNWSLKGNANLILTRELKFSADMDVKSSTVTAQGQNDLFYMTNAALDYAPKKMKNWSFSFRLLDILGSNNKGLDTRAFDKDGLEIFYQETEYNRAGPIAEISVSYAFRNGKSQSKTKKTVGDREF
ncbi:TonB-dependent receptor domain-containing protein [Saccharicrinis fermentans]|uniref:Outer membrane cobalamin receptor protein n=1 Tax=Saccharicrinis fermentans DSM 9555 = JCM 21142 TaxID=869213 RepID=W7XX39_9BACT|nr:TonB-dependent receptor [Saccharicrinis fermentans]GAF03005.1 outer membrane cobalamin receptor protein [Saccharicrinis fermentans DSM 9555 = JCM 21142]